MAVLSERNTHLTGMKEISAYLQRSETTVLKLIHEYRLPAKKLMGVWESDTRLIDEWRVGLLNGTFNA